MINLRSNANSEILYGSDHPIHVRIIKTIIKDNFKTFPKNIFTFQEYASYYPTLYHFLLALFFPKKSIENPKIIQKSILLIKVIFFNLFIYLLQKNNDYGTIDIIILNSIYITFPFSYTFWNAKNTGLSARSFGLLIGELYVYSIFIFLTNGSNLNYFISAILFSFLAMLTSMMTFQFIVLSSPIISILYGNILVLLIPICSSFLYYIFFKKQFKIYIDGLYNFYRNYYNYLNQLILIKNRPNIFRDFIFDFWKLLFDKSKSLKQKILYIYLNPIMELIHGFPYLIFLIYFFAQNYTFNLIEFGIPFSVIILFFVICINPLRFLGEPQRYVEYIIPIITLIFYNNINFQITVYLIIVSSIYILTLKLISKKIRNIDENKIKALEYIKNHFEWEDIIISNDSYILKYVSAYTNIFALDTSKELTNSEVDDYFIKDYGTISKSKIINLTKKYDINAIIINLQKLNSEDLQLLKSEINIKMNLKYKNENFLIFKLKH